MPKRAVAVQPISQLLPRRNAPRQRDGVKKPSFGANPTAVSASLAGVGSRNVTGCEVLTPFVSTAGPRVIETIGELATIELFALFVPPPPANTRRALASV